jgi:arsenate reductase
MAEGFARHLGAGHVEAWSAGLISAEVSEMASKVMKEAGVDISNQRSKFLEEIPLEEMDLVVTLCESAGQACVSVPARGRKLHIPVKDPTGAQGSPRDVMDEFHKARDEIKAIVCRILKEMNVPSEAKD